MIEQTETSAEEAFELYKKGWVDTICFAGYVADLDRAPFMYSENSRRYKFFSTLESGGKVIELVAEDLVVVRSYK